MLDGDRETERVEGVSFKPPRFAADWAIDIMLQSSRSVIERKWRPRGVRYISFSCGSSVRYPLQSATREQLVPRSSTTSAICNGDALLTAFIVQERRVHLSSNAACFDRLHRRRLAISNSRSQTRRCQNTRFLVELFDFYLRLGGYVFTCVFVRQSVNRIIQNYRPTLLFYGMVGHNLRNNQLDFEWPWPKDKVTRGQKVRIVFLQITPLKIVIQSRDRIVI